MHEMLDRTVPHEENLAALDHRVAIKIAEVADFALR